MNAEFSLVKLEYKSAWHTLCLFLEDFDGNKDQSSVEKHEMQPFRATGCTRVHGISASPYEWNSMEKDCGLNSLYVYMPTNKPERQIIRS